MYFCNGRVKKNNLTCHSCKSDIVENLTLLDLSIVNISLTISLTYSKLIFFDPYHITSNLIRLRGYFKHIKI